MYYKYELSKQDPANFTANGLRPAVGAPYMEPCLDDEGDRLATGVTGDFFGPNGEADLVPGGYTSNTNGAGQHYSWKNWLPRWEADGPGTGWLLSCHP